MLEKQFIPYKYALKLKELGFNEQCFGWWCWINGDKAIYYGYSCTNIELSDLNTFPNNCSAPLWQQAFAFLMTDDIPDNYNLHCNSGGWTLLDDDKWIYYDDEKALEKLIKIYDTKRNIKTSSGNKGL
jgi:hypothetical protein